MKYLRRWLGLQEPARLCHPDRPLVVIGDIHGRLDLLEQMLEALAQQEALSGTHDLVLVGDLIDRGPDSRAVLDLVMDLSVQAPDRVTVLMGNHERMMLDALENTSDGTKWLRVGGLQTLQSLGIPVPEALTGESPVAHWIEQARASLGPSLRTWLQARPLMFRSGDVVVVHAAFDRSVPDHDQPPQDLLWGSSEFYRRPHTACPWVVHGHVITRPAAIEGTRIAVDSGAWVSGVLSAALLCPDTAPRLISVGA